jgi:alpha-mannosidase
VDLSAGDAGVSVLKDPALSWEATGRRISLTLSAPRTTYAVYPHAGDWRTATGRYASELNAPMIAFRAPSHRGPAGPAASFLTVDAHNVRVGAVKRAEVGPSAVVRLVEWHGRPASATVAFDRPVSRVRTATLLEDPVAVLPLREGRVTLALGPWEIVTLLVDDWR